ncbi:MAG: serine/threonine protein kinase [Coriobacteriales bacterium]|nr:serine/threonine protein kinase [Coriobacteriales bacterium]
MESELLLNRYILQDRLGGGSGGEVNLAWDTRMRRNVAIKRIPLPIYQQSDSIPGLEEARTAAKLSDQRIISVHDFEETGNEALLIMEFVDGISLGALMDTIPRLLTPDEIASIAQNVGKALQYAHNHNVLHLDVKPDNVMLDMSGQTKMTDFGLARLGQRSGFGVATGGTIGYMPPEQLSGGEVSEATDQWAFAMVIYELVTGSNPFIAPTFAESANLIASSDIYLPSSIREEFDEEFDEILFTALSIDPQERFASIGEFITELIPHLGNPKNGRARLKSSSRPCASR